MSFVYYPLFLFANMVSTRLKISLPCWKVFLNPLDLVTFDRWFLTIYNLLLVPLGFLTLLKSILFVYIFKLFLFHLRFIKHLTIVFLSDLIILKVSIVSEFWHIFSFQHCLFISSCAILSQDFLCYVSETHCLKNKFFFMKNVFILFIYAIVLISSLLLYFELLCCSFPSFLTQMFSQWSSKF